MSSSMLKGRPALLVVCCFAVGIAIERSLSWINNPAAHTSILHQREMLFVGIFLLVIIIQLLVFAWKRSTLTLVFVQLAILLVGYTSSAVLDLEYLTSPISQLAEVKPSHFVLCGKIVSPFEQN